jgi:hypothetical protein
MNCVMEYSIQSASHIYEVPTMCILYIGVIVMPENSNVTFSLSVPWLPCCDQFILTLISWVKCSTPVVKGVCLWVGMLDVKAARNDHPIYLISPPIDTS